MSTAVCTHCYVRVLCIATGPHDAGGVNSRAIISALAFCAAQKMIRGQCTFLCLLCLGKQIFGVLALSPAVLQQDSHSSASCSLPPFAPYASSPVHHSPTMCLEILLIWHLTARASCVHWPHSCREGQQWQHHQRTQTDLCLRQR